MAVARVLFVKLSSLGDVIHHLPAVSDLAAQRPGTAIHWAVEEGYAGLVRLHPGVERVIPVGLRRTRGAPFARASWGDLLAARRALRESAYDYVVDTQGLAKSALVARAARGPAFGFDRASARERFAARFYDIGIPVARALHAVERNRLLCARVFGYRVDSTADYGLVAPGTAPAWAPSQPYVVALHAASRASKRWPEAHWTALAARLAERGWVVVYPGGTAAERATAAGLAAATPGALAAPAMDLVEAAALLAGAQGVVGVDTGLTHLAVALGRPTIGLFTATDPALTGLHGGERVVNLGGAGLVPTVEQVMAELGGDGAPSDEGVGDVAEAGLDTGTW